MNVDIDKPIDTTTVSMEGLQVIWQSPIGVVDTLPYLNQGVVIVNDQLVATPEKLSSSIVYA